MSLLLKFLNTDTRRQNNGVKGVPTKTPPIILVGENLIVEEVPQQVGINNIHSYTAKTHVHSERRTLSIGESRFTLHLQDSLQKIHCEGISNWGVPGTPFTDPDRSWCKLHAPAMSAGSIIAPVHISGNPSARMLNKHKHSNPLHVRTRFWIQG